MSEESNLFMIGKWKYAVEGDKKIMSNEDTK